MKKMFRIAMCAVLTLALVFSFVACDDDAKNEEEAKKVVENFMDDFCKLDVEGMSEHCADGDAFIDEIGYDNFKEELIDRMKKETSSELATQLEPLFEGMIEIVSDTVEYKIRSTKKVDDKYIVTVKYTSIDFEQMATYSSEAFSDENSQQMAKELADELVANGTITENSTQEEIVAALISGMTDMVLDELKTEINSFDKVDKTVEITVVEKDGKWLIDEESLDFVGKFLE